MQPFITLLYSLFVVVAVKSSYQMPRVYVRMFVDVVSRSSCVSMSLCVCRRSQQVDLCVVNTRRLQMTDFDSALYLLNCSQSDALGAPKVSLFHMSTMLFVIDF